MFPRYGDTRGMDHMRLHPARPQPARQPEAVPPSFEGQCNPRDLAAGLDRLVTPAMQQAKQPFCTRVQLLARLALNAGKHTGNQPTRLVHLDDGNDRAILVQGDSAIIGTAYANATGPVLLRPFQRAVALELSFFEAAYT